ncbi:vWA domain-containing protein [Mucilaginibacter flavus]|uniref:vWA domain-containing protein n=1 Tax=Mucilaginibacter flavus TaxID=931504 RepID=UPI0025B50384|nr:VWA domain-containing protein [Mucilaginibacter flavus]MDN3582526.1 VWA domain-containing protein [Mucilaginibacter flavus]
MSMDEYVSFEQIPFGSDDFANNPESRCPCLLLLDTSGSMGGMPIQQLNEGVLTLKSELINDPLASKRVEVAMVTFGPVSLKQDFTTVDNFFPQPLSAEGDTPIGAAITTGIDMIAKRKQVYKENGVGYYKPWIILITDGAPTDSWHHAADLVREGEEKNSFAFFAIGVEGASMDTLAKLSVRSPIKLKGLMFREFFLWLSSSMKMVSSKNPGTPTKLLPPTGWGEV